MTSVKDRFVKADDWCENHPFWSLVIAVSGGIVAAVGFAQVLVLVFGG